LIREWGETCGGGGVMRKEYLHLIWSTGENVGKNAGSCLADVARREFQNGKLTDEERRQLNASSMQCFEAEMRTLTRMHEAIKDHLG
jgi:hypothetical protein